LVEGLRGKRENLREFTLNEVKGILAPEPSQKRASPQGRPFF
jgi:hypothetical protein